MPRPYTRTGAALPGGGGARCAGSSLRGDDSLCVHVTPHHLPLFTPLSRCSHPPVPQMPSDSPCSVPFQLKGQNRPQSLSTLLSGREPGRQAQEPLPAFTSSVGGPPFSLENSHVASDMVYVVKELSGNMPTRLVTFFTLVLNLDSPDLGPTLCPTSQPRALQQWLSRLYHIWLMFLAFVGCFVFILSLGKTRLEFFKGILLMCWGFYINR